MRVCESRSVVSVLTAQVRRRMTMDVPFTSWETAVQKLGKEEAFKCLADGWKGRQYRKKQNAKNQAILELAKKDPRFKDLTMEQAVERLERSRKSA